MFIYLGTHTDSQIDTEGERKKGTIKEKKVINLKSNKIEGIRGRAWREKKEGRIT